MAMNYTYSDSRNTYQREEQRREQERASAPKQCPHCQAPINLNLGHWEKVRYHCGSDRCRAAAYRHRKANRLQAAREAANARINDYAAGLPAEQAMAVRAMRDVLMSDEPPSYSHGHEQALAIIAVIDDRRCKHDRIQILIDNAEAEKRRAAKVQEHYQELEAAYKRRIDELEAEITVYQMLENAIHGIASEQLRKQPDPLVQPQPWQAEEDPDRPRVLAALAQMGAKPYAGQDDDDEPEAEDEEDPEA